MKLARAEARSLRILTFWVEKRWSDVILKGLVAQPAEVEKDTKSPRPPIGEFLEFFGPFLGKVCKAEPA